MIAANNLKPTSLIASLLFCLAGLPRYARNDNLLKLSRKIAINN
jgi:hypothetical protein